MCKIPRWVCGSWQAIGLVAAASSGFAFPLGGPSVLLEGDLGGSAPSQAAGPFSGPRFFSKSCLLKRGGGLRHGAGEQRRQKHWEGSERRVGKKIPDNVFNLTHSPESLKCIFPWTLNCLSWSNQSNRLFSPLKIAAACVLMCGKSVEILPSCVSVWEQPLWETLGAPSFLSEAANAR